MHSTVIRYPVTEKYITKTFALNTHSYHTQIPTIQGHTHTPGSRGRSVREGSSQEGTAEPHHPCGSSRQIASPSGRCMCRSHTTRGRNTWGVGTPLHRHTHRQRRRHGKCWQVMAGVVCTRGTSDGGKCCTRGRSDGGKCCTRGTSDGGKCCTRGRSDGGKCCTRCTSDGGVARGARVMVASVARARVAMNVLEMEMA